VELVHVRCVGCEGEEKSREGEGKVGRKEELCGEIPTQETFLLEENAVILTENKSYINRNDIINHFFKTNIQSHRVCLLLYLF
jgi:hypothetical protein